MLIFFQLSTQKSNIDFISCIIQHKKISANISCKAQYLCFLTEPLKAPFNSGFNSPHFVFLVFLDSLSSCLYSFRWFILFLFCSRNKHDANLLLTDRPSISPDSPGGGEPSPHSEWLHVLGYPSKAQESWSHVCSSNSTWHPESAIHQCWQSFKCFCKMNFVWVHTLALLIYKSLWQKPPAIFRNNMNWLILISERPQWVRMFWEIEKGNVVYIIKELKNALVPLTGFCY